MCSRAEWISVMSRAAKLVIPVCSLGRVASEAARHIVEARGRARTGCEAKALSYLFFEALAAILPCEFPISYHEKRRDERHHPSTRWMHNSAPRGRAY